ncbi:MAG TPA: hypothetical protein VL357_06195 [Rariglobus sp.]|nr:hypothetical protein [Rariglobus sp.]
MRVHATRLPTLVLPEWGLDLPPVRFLTGARFAHQTAYCAQSLLWSCETRLRCEFFDDGSLRPVDTENLLRLFPKSRVITAGESEARLDLQLPRTTFPLLRAMRDRSPLMRKLLDLRAGLSGPNLYLDSDMLFFSQPTRLLAWLRNPKGELYMNEPGHDGAYVAAPGLIENQLELPHSLPLGVNTGIVAMDDSSLDWRDMERCAGLFTEEQRFHPWAEQTLTACHFSRSKAAALSAIDYRVCASRSDIVNPPPMLRHYVYKSKMPYLQNEWLKWEVISRKSRLSKSPS